MFQNDEQSRRSTAESFVVIFFSLCGISHFIMKGSRTKAVEYEGSKISENVFPFQEGQVEVVRRTWDDLHQHLRLKSVNPTKWDC